MEYGISHIEYRISNIEYRISNIEYRISNIEYRISYIAYRISNIEYRISHIAYRISNIEYRISYIAYRISHIEYRISNIEYRISNIAYRISLMSGAAFGTGLTCSYMRRRASPVTEISENWLENFPYEHSGPVTGMKIERSRLFHLGNRAEISSISNKKVLGGVVLLIILHVFSPGILDSNFIICNTY